MMRHLVPAFAASLTLLTGCFCSNYRKTAYYDLDPAPQTVRSEVRIAELKNVSGAGSRFQYREKDGRIVTDPDCKWILPPGTLVARALSAALKPSGNGAMRKARVSGDLLFFETDRANGNFHLRADLVVRSGDREKTIRCDLTIPVRDTRPETVVAAANQAVNELVKQLSEAL